MHLNSGALLQGGKYRIESVLGQGGFGITYVAEQTDLGRKVAIKEFFMKDFCDRDHGVSDVSIPSKGSKELVDRFKAKFIKEAMMIAAMQDSHVIQIYERFEENGTAYYAMEYIPDGSLKDCIPAGGFPESEALGYVRQIADALRYIHEEKHVLHLDVKPSNVLVRKNGEVVLIDFGISKHYDDDGGEQTSSSPVGVSRGYAPLEQYNAGGVSQFSPATDIYSLGAVLYALLTGQAPPDANVVLNAGLPEISSDVSPQVKAAIDAAMQPRRIDRPQSVKEFLQMLDGPAQPQSQPQPQPQPQQSQPQPQQAQPKPVQSQPSQPAASGTFDEQYGRLCRAKRYDEAFALCVEHIGKVPNASVQAMASIEKYFAKNYFSCSVPVPETVSYEWLTSLFTEKGYSVYIENGVLQINNTASAEIRNNGKNRHVTLKSRGSVVFLSMAIAIALIVGSCLCLFYYNTATEPDLYGGYSKQYKHVFDNPSKDPDYTWLIIGPILAYGGGKLGKWGTSRGATAGRIIAQALVEEKKKGKAADTDETVL